MDGQTSLSLKCKEYFHDLRDALKDEFGNKLAMKAVEEELGRFRLWASNIGAMSTRRASLDRRLKMQHVQQAQRSATLPDPDTNQHGPYPRLNEQFRTDLNC